MEDSTLWWLAIGAAVIIELFTGTFYLLMLAVGLVAGSIAAYAGFGLASQLLTGAAVGGSSIAAAYLYQGGRPDDFASRSDCSVNLDVGEIVQIESWKPDGTANVKYRGAQWTAIHRCRTTPGVGAHRVAELVGNRLLVDRL
ncbi:MAG: Membrane protein [Candidatus Tokpelaia sp. JSC189]|nr:MAG: Membrane protein [Candidatus Tokpelaia sp. JSC189]